MAEILTFPDTSTTSRRPRVEPEPLWREILGEQLRRRRREREETLGETAATAGVSPQYLSEVERGLKEPSSEMIAAIAGALETTLLELAGGVADRLRASAAPDSAAVSSGHGAFALAA